MPSSSPHPNSVPTIMLSPGIEPPRYPALRFASSAFRLLAILELATGGVLWMVPATTVGVLPGVLTGLWVAAGALMLWVAADFCELVLELVHHLRARGR